MKEYSTDSIRNIALIGHSSSGKTTVAESMLAQGKAIPKMGSVDNGSSVMDWDPFEIDKKSTLNLSMASLGLKDIKINIIDTPGFPDFSGDVVSSLNVCEGAVSVVCASSGIQVQTIQTWGHARNAEKPIIIFINKMDRENADFDKVYENLKQSLGADKVTPVAIPIGSQDNFKGIVDLIKNKAVIDGKISEIPDDLKNKTEKMRNVLMENVAGLNEELMNTFLDSGDLSEEQIENGLKQGVADSIIIPVLCGSSLSASGINELINIINKSIPAPKADSDKPCAVVFKTIVDNFIGKLSYFKVISGNIKADESYKNNRTNNQVKGKISHIFGKKLDDIPNAVTGDIGAFVKIDELRAGDVLGEKIDLNIPFPKPCHAIAIEVEKKGTEDKLATGLSKLVDDDPVMEVKRDKETHQTIIHGLGETQIGLVLKKLEKDFKVATKRVELIVPYRETIQKKSHGDYRHKKQSGGAGQFAHVIIDIEPLERGKQFEFVNKIVGGAIPKGFIPAVEKGVLEAMINGTLAGFPVVDVRVYVVDGKDHPVDSNEMAFKIAGRGAFRKAQEGASPIILEPVYEMKIIIPDDFTGDIISDLNQRRGRVEGMEPIGNGFTRVKAQAPYAEILSYTIDLKGLTQGRGNFEINFSTYQPVPANIQQKIIEKYSKKDTDSE